MHLLAIFLQYLLSRLANMPQKQPAVARARTSEASQARRQGLESATEARGDIARLTSTIIMQARRAELRGSGTACRAGPNAQTLRASCAESAGALPASLSIASDVPTSSATSTAEFSPPLRT